VFLIYKEASTYIALFKLALGGQTNPAAKWSLSDHSGQSWILDRDGYDAIDPKRTLPRYGAPQKLDSGVNMLLCNLAVGPLHFPRQTPVSVSQR